MFELRKIYIETINGVNQMVPNSNFFKSNLVTTNTESYIISSYSTAIPIIFLGTTDLQIPIQMAL